MPYKDFISKIPKWCQAALESAPQNYATSLAGSSSADLKCIIEFLQSINQLGVLGFGYRTFLKSGSTSMLALNADWHELMQVEGFEETNLKFVTDELLLAVRNNIRVLTRTRDKTDSNYLSQLDQTSINNGIVIYNYSPTQIEVSYFHCLEPHDRDFLLNKTQVIQSLIDQSKPALRRLISAENMKLLYRPCLNQQQLKVCFSNLGSMAKSNGAVDVAINGKTIELSNIDIECLYFLKFGGSTTHIAECVGRTPSAIKDRIRSLKDKFDIQTKNELVYVARNELAFLTKHHL